MLNLIKISFRKKKRLAWTMNERTNNASKDKKGRLCKFSGFSYNSEIMVALHYVKHYQVNGLTKK